MPGNRARSARRGLATVLVLVALLAVLDRVAHSAAQHDVAERLQADAHLTSAPSVQIHGYPFLTQLIGGDYDDIDVVMRGLDSNGVRIDRLSIHLQGAHIPLGDVLRQDRSRIHVDHATAQLELAYPDVHRATVTSVSVRGGDTVVLHTSAVDVPIKLDALPFGIRLTSAKTTQAGIEVTGTANELTLHA
jgi:hypothetical protein